MGEVDWENVTKSINGYYSTTLTTNEVKRIFNDVFDEVIEPIQQRIAALVDSGLASKREALESVAKRKKPDRDAFGRKLRR